jgi:hypothetical protein
MINLKATTQYILEISISRPITPKAETITLHHAARAQNCLFGFGTKAPDPEFELKKLPIKD